MALVLVCMGGCRGSHTTPTSPTVGASPTAAPAATVAGTPTADLGSSVPDGERALAHVRKLSVDIGPRVAGTPSESAARDYLKATLESFGYSVSLQEFGFDASAFRPARVDLGAAPIPAYAFRGSASGSATGRIITAGIGRPEEFPPTGLNGAVALIARGDLTFSEKVGNAIQAGAAGVIIYNDADGSFLGGLTTGVSIPVVAIARQDGQDLAARSASPIDATITVAAPQGTAYNVIARPAEGATCATVTGGHYDSVPVTGGADDNASGSAAVLEAARVAAVRHMTAGNCFVLFSAEEFGLFGSKAYVEEMSGADRSALRGMVNLDVVGLPQPLTLIGSDDLVDTARLAAGTVQVDAARADLPRGVGSDHLSFQDGGFPVVMLYRDDNQIHTPADAIDRIRSSSLQETVSVALATLAAINPP